MKWIFWDNDGVLVDTEHLYLEATRGAIADTGFELTDELYQEFFLRQNLGIWHLIEGYTEDALQVLKDTRNGLYAQLLQAGSLVIPGAIETLKALAPTYRMGIVTSSQPAHFDIIHRTTGILNLLEFAITPDFYTNSKPSPDPYLKALELSGAHPTDCLVIEDSERGLAAAKAAGIECWVIPSRLTNEMEFAGADRKLGSITELPSALRASRFSSAS